MGITDVLGTYTLQELFELNDLTEEEVLVYLIGQGVIKLPDPLPVDLVIDDE